jgi:heme-degrading monooxygenase HmoA
MYTSVVDLTTKQGTASELTQAVNDEVRPILEKQTGFVDVTVIISDTEPNRVLALSFWNTREDVQRYEREQFDAVHKTLQHILETAPVVRTFAVHTSTTHRIAAGKAA